MRERAISTPPRTLAGWSLAHIATVLLAGAALLWAVWATRTLLELRERRIVTVSLSRLVEDFVAAEARNGGSAEQSTKRTALYLGAVHRAIADLGRDGTTVLVSEATLGRSATDSTDQVRKTVARAMEASDAQR